jgi:hypothetical protein
MGEVQVGVPLRLCALLKDELSLTSAVESGTFMAESAIALRGIFGNVWSIELSSQFYEAANARHASDGLKFIHGASHRVLPDLLREINDSALFWLDGHWSGGDTAGGDRECAVLDEIAAIDAWPHAAGSAVLIDDARLFLGPPPAPHKPEDWPNFPEVLDTLRSHFDRYVAVFDDVIIAGPPLVQPLVERYRSEMLATSTPPLAAETRLRETKARLDDAEAEIRALRCSMSWRVTAPFRLLTGVFRRRRWR